MWQAAVAVVTHATLGDWALLLTGVLFLLYIAGTWNYNYFKRRGVASTKPKYPFLGDMATAFFGRRSFYDVLIDQYKEGEGHSVFGIFEFTSPVYVIRDPELLKVVAVKDFDSFINHRAVQSGNADPIFSRNLFHLKDQAWRDMRATLSPAFTTSKIKTMFSLISECAQQMTQHLQEKYSNSKEGALNQPIAIDMKDLFSRLANDVIATAAFGVSCDSLKHPENEFYHMGKRVTTFSATRIFVFLSYLLFPKIIRSFGVRLLDPKSTDFFDTLVHETIRERKQKSIYRPDVLQLLIQAQEGKLNTEAHDTAEVEEMSAKKASLSNTDVSAQAIIFFFAGFDTVTSALCLISHVLSHHEHEQKRLQREITEALQKTGGKATYESVQSMKYLDAVINEVLRLYPPAGATDRQCQRDIQLPVSGSTGSVSICRGQVINIPILGLHHDPKYWDDPEKFDPQRFSDENKHKIKPFTYMPFGLGPRNCIGQRFALIEVKLVLVHLLANFDLLPSAKTKFPLEFATGVNLNAKNGFWCDLKPREAQLICEVEDRGTNCNNEEAIVERRNYS